MNTNVLILDDDPASRGSLERSVMASGLSTIAPEGPFGSIDQLEEFARAEGVTHLVTDHRLREKNFSSFLGANAARALNLIKIAPILVTAYAQQDLDHFIRPHLGFIPRVVRQSDVKPKVLREALEISAAEVIEGQVTRSRQKYRSIVSIDQIIPHPGSGPNEVRLKIRQWRKDETVGFPVNAFAENIKKNLVPELLLIAEVNIEAETANDLFLMNFELPPEDDSYDL